LEDEYKASLKRELNVDVPTDDEMARARTKRRMPDTSAREEEEARSMLLSKKKRKLWRGYKKAKTRKARHMQHLREKKSYIESLSKKV